MYDKRLAALRRLQHIHVSPEGGKGVVVSVVSPSFARFYPGSTHGVAYGSRGVLLHCVTVGAYSTSA